MDHQFVRKLGTIFFIFTMFFLVSCNDQMPSRSTISKDNVSTDEPPTECPEGERLVPATDDTIAACEPIPPTRPSDAISFKADFCACKDGKPVSFGNCTSFCVGKNTAGAEDLFASFDITAAISLSGLGSVNGWCNQNLTAEDTANPKCAIEAKDSEGNTILAEVKRFTSNNAVVADVSGLAFDKTYVLTLVETSTGARSRPAQIIKPSVDIPPMMLGPLKQAPISQYACVIRQFSVDTTNQQLFYEKAYRVHFYYHPRLPPNTVNANNIFCHDIVKFGNADDPTYPRFENIPGRFNLWDSTDPRFFDNNGNGNDDINEVIAQKTRNFGGNVAASSRFFIKFSWPGSPTLNEDAGNSATTSTTNPIGFYMAPWIDQQNNFKSFCLNSTYYQSNNPLFKAFRDVIGVDTEGLYVGEKAAETIFNSQNQPVGTGVKDFILIRETDLKQVWFYLKDNVPTKPTDDNVANVAVYFYYPLNPSAPFIKSSSQRIYRVRGGAELSGGNTTGAQPTGSSTSFPPHDRKIGCIPKF